MALRARRRVYSGLEIEIVHRRSPAAEVEQISINLQAVPSFEAFGQFLQTANPFPFWAQAAQMAWFPWLGAARLIHAGRPESVLPALKVVRSIGHRKKTEEYNACNVWLRRARARTAVGAHSPIKLSEGVSLNKA